MPLKNISGMRFGRLTALEVSGKVGRRLAWRCRCDCGAYASVQGGLLRSGDTRSCGCLQDETRRTMNLRHGMAGTRVYRIWSHMRRRCKDPRAIRWLQYGGRGIRVCERWAQFENFFKDMGEPPTPTHSIDRIDVDGNYEPHNCRWATPKEQAANKRPRLRRTHCRTHGTPLNARRRCLQCNREYRERVNGPRPAHRYNDVSGNRYGRWTAILPALADGRYRGKWIVRCDCGLEVSRYIGSIRNGGSSKCRACECRARELALADEAQERITLFEHALKDLR